MTALQLTPERQQLVAEHQNLVWWVVHRVHAPVWVESAELFQEGCLALVQAALRFEASPGVRFAGYAKRWVWGAVIRHLRWLEQRCPQWGPMDRLEPAVLDRLVVESWLERLSGRDRLVVQAIALDDRSASDVALELGQPMRRVTQWYGRALNRLQARMQLEGTALPRSRRRGRREVSDRDAVQWHDRRRA